MNSQLALPAHDYVLRVDRFGTPRLAPHGPDATRSRTAAARFALLEALAERRRVHRSR